MKYPTYVYTRTPRYFRDRSIFMYLRTVFGDCVNTKEFNNALDIACGEARKALESHGRMDVWRSDIHARLIELLGYTEDCD